MPVSDVHLSLEITETESCNTTLGVHERLLGAANEPRDEESLDNTRGVSKAPPQTIWGVLTSPLTRKGVRIVTITQIAQQASGINAG